MWSSTYSSRRSHEQPHNESKNSRSSSPGEALDSHRRTSSEATPRPTPANTRFLTASNDQDGNKNVLAPHSADVFTSSSKRLGFLADKLSSSLSGTVHNQKNQTQLLLPHGHSRGDSSATSVSLSPSTAPMASSASLANAAKAHTSPSKQRTYDPKLVTREMHRLGNMSQLSSLAPQLSSAPSATSLSLPPPSMSQVSLASTSTTDPWGSLHVHVLPLFNGEPLRIPIEDLNTLVKNHISTVVSSSPSRALAKLENDASELIASGMVTLNAKLMGVDDEKLVARLVETWGFFWDQILTYVEGVLLPLQTDPTLNSLSRTSKQHHRATSPVRTTGHGPQASKSSAQLINGTPTIDVRTVALKSFRDRVVYPLYPRLHARLSLPNRQDVFQETGGYQQPRLQQMLLVLSAQSRQRPVAMSLTAPVPQPTPEEAAISDLLHLVRNPHPQTSARKQPFKTGFQPRTPSFLSGGLPRDRRGRIAKKKTTGPSDLSTAVGPFDDDDLGDDTPRHGLSSGTYVLDIDREKEREMLEALRSPEPNTRASIGGWGLGGIHEVPMKSTEEEEEEDELDQAQADLESYMASMNSPVEPSKRR
ncbi:HbrB-domain-containing protein [Coprinopsis marcescibilis]|uniref:HbrB-domain-containing protein n=1 Tax=Coprinopsis marcescibilis TaxID=230819 RepID=A0A5C3KYG8_COPMA|nr:HbrB-domain-containing protein [Coprinopsis marcescibilis]